MTPEQSLQAQEYAFPYHYIPARAPRYRLNRGWTFAPSYLAALDLVEDWLATASAEERAPWRHLDIGCGDGALLWHLSQSARLSDRVELTGIDRDPRSIQWAEMFGAGRYFCRDISEMPAASHDSATLIEVLEHIPPTEIPDFVARIAAVLRPGGRLVVTVPSTAKKLQPKHFQHFTALSLTAALAPEFEIEDLRGFERHSLASRAAYLAAYRLPVRIEADSLSRLMVRRLGRRHPDPAGCGRLWAVARRR